MNATASPKSVTVALRLSPEGRERLGQLAKIIGVDLGTRVSLSQTVEVAVNEALGRRCGNEDYGERK